MIARNPVRMLVIVAVVVLVGVRGIVGGSSWSGGLLGGSDGFGPPAVGERTRAVVAFVLDGDMVEVTTHRGKKVRVRFLGIKAPELPQPGEPGESHS